MLMRPLSSCSALFNTNCSQVELTEQQPIRRRGLEKILGSMMRLMAGRGL